MSLETVIIGGGAHARVIAEALGPVEASGYVAPRPCDAHGRLGEYLGDDDRIAALAARGAVFALGIGFVDRSGARRRADLLNRLGDAPLLTIVHPAAIVSPSAVIGPGVFVAAGAVVGTGVELGCATIVNTGAIVDHDSTTGQNVHLAPAVVLSGGVTVGESSLVGVGAAIRQNTSIGEFTVVGAGAVVVGDVPPQTTVVGIPAKPMRLGE